MWVCSGPFDGETTGVVNFQKSKLLKPGRSYAVGRKKQPLIINNKSVSVEHLVFVVGEYSEDDASNPDVIPSLKVVNKSSKPRQVQYTAQEEQESISPGSSRELHDGDVFFALNDVSLTVRWEKVCCYSSPSREQFPPPIKACAELGISLVVTPHPNVTHHLVSSYTLKPVMAASLLSLANFVKPDWLTTLLSNGDSGNGPSALENAYALPRIQDYKPDYSPSIPSTLKSSSTWEPNEQRVALFREYRILFLGEKGREASSDEKDLVKRGGGDYECFAVSRGRNAFHNVLAKGNSKGKNLVLVADEHLMGTVIGEDFWQEFVQESSEYGLKFVRPEKLVSAVVHIDMSYVDCKLSQTDKVVDRFASPIPDVVPNTLAAEPTYPQTLATAPTEPEAPKKMPLRRRAAPVAEVHGPVSTEELVAPVASSSALNGQSASDPPQSATAEPSLPPRRKLVRRARTPVPQIIGIDDPSAVLDAPPVLDSSNATSSAPAQKELLVPPTPGRIRLKRRLGTQQPNIGLDPRSETAQTTETQEPAHKKFKALFDESDPDKIARSDLEEYRSMYSQKQSFTQSEGELGSGPRTSGLNVVPEEEEESAMMVQLASETQLQNTQASGTRGQKRKIGDDDVEMEDEDNPRHKQRKEGPTEPTVVERSTGKKTPESTSVEKTKSKLGKTKVTVAKAEKTGAEGKTDKDEAFLKAVASTKRGKRKEDDFDREFNNLKISKPDLRRDDAANEWAVLEEFGDDGDLRGNFMVVVEMDVFRKEPRKDQSVYRRGESRLDWEGKPDFKKFKKKSTGERRAPIELIVEEEPEFAFGTNLRLVDSQPQDVRSQPNKRKRAALAPDSDDDTIIPLTRRRNPKATSPIATQQPKSRASAPPSRAGSEKSQPRSSQRKGKGKQTTLFIDDSDDELETTSTQLMHLEDSPEPERRPIRKTTTRRKPAVDDDSDDDLAFKGFGRRKR